MVNRKAGQPADAPVIFAKRLVFFPPQAGPFIRRGTEIPATSLRARNIMALAAGMV